MIIQVSRDCSNVIQAHTPVTNFVVHMISVGSVFHTPCYMNWEVTGRRHING